jgi:hypothetical protein
MARKPGWKQRKCSRLVKAGKESSFKVCMRKKSLSGRRVKVSKSLAKRIRAATRAAKKNPPRFVIHDTSTWDGYRPRRRRRSRR